MSDEVQSAKIEICLYAFFSFIAFAVIINAMSLPAPTREPLGSGALPQAVSVIVILLCGALALRAGGVLKNARKATEVKTNEAQAMVKSKFRYDRAAAIFAYALIYVALQQSRLVSSGLLTPIFLGFCIWTLQGFNKKAILPMIAVAVVLGYGTSEVFKQIFYIDLP